MPMGHCPIPAAQPRGHTVPALGAVRHFTDDGSPMDSAPAQPLNTLAGALRGCAASNVEVSYALFVEGCTFMPTGPGAWLNRGASCVRKNER